MASSPKFNAAWLGKIGIPRDQVRALEEAVGLVPVVAGLPVRAVSASVSKVYTWISNDSGGTWDTASPQTQTATFYDADGAVIATQVISAARVDLTGEITASTGAHVGEDVTITYPSDNGSSQVVSVVVKHDDSAAQTTLTWQSLTDTTALGGFSGGPSK